MTILEMVSILDGIGSTKWPCFDLEASAKSPGDHLKVGVCNISLKNNLLALHYLNELVLNCFFWIILFLFLLLFCKENAIVFTYIDV